MVSSSIQIHSETECKMQYNNEKNNNSSSSPNHEKDSEADKFESNTTSFDKSLQELRDLRSQLHYAADYCESAFLTGKEKKAVMENTKEYLCRAVVTVVDHLGTVSSSFNSSLSQTHSFSQLHLRIDSLNQRLVLCQEYAHNLALNRFRRTEHLPRYHSRYVSTTAKAKNSERLNGASRHSKDGSLETEEELPFFLYTESTLKSSAVAYNKKLIPAGIAENYKEGDYSNKTLVLPTPVLSGFLASLSKAPDPNFQFQVTKKNGRYRKSIHGSDILSIIWRAKRTIAN